jgi:hypothetical protein
MGKVLMINSVKNSTIKALVGASLEGFYDICPEDFCSKDICRYLPGKSLPGKSLPGKSLPCKYPPGKCPLGKLLPQMYLSTNVSEQMS